MDLKSNHEFDGGKEFKVPNGRSEALSTHALGMLPCELG